MSPVSVDMKLGGKLPTVEESWRNIVLLDKPNQETFLRAGGSRVRAMLIGKSIYALLG